MSKKIEIVTAEYQDYLNDESHHSGSAEKIIFASSEDDVIDALKSGLPVTVQGARTGITAGAVPVGGLILNLSRMNRIQDINNRRIVVRPGALLTEIRAVTADSGLFFPPDPTEASASIGGMIACNASGALSYHYGPTRNWIHALRIILPDGDSLHIKRGTRAKGLSFELTTESGRLICGSLPLIKRPDVKNAAGYFVMPDMDLVDLFIGMEGTLGIITEAELNLIPLPPVRQALCAFFPKEESALEFTRYIRENLHPVAIEFFGHFALDLLRNAEMDLPDLPERLHTAIYFEFHGDDNNSVDAEIMDAAEKMAELGADEDDCWMADNPRELEVHKAFRHATPEAVNLLIGRRKKECPGITKLGTDMSVPNESLETVISLYRNDLETANLQYVIFGHIGDNHLHVNILPRDMNEMSLGKHLYIDWAIRVVDMGGSVSAEHGIGKLKTALLETMFGAEGIDAMREIKSLFDEHNILNRGNLFRYEHE